MSEKIVGWILIATGIIFIIYPAFSVYRVFTKQSQPTKLFNFSGISINPSQIVGASQLPDSLKGIPIPTTAPMELIKPEIVNDTTNLFYHIIFMGFIAGIGYKLAAIGAMLVRPVVVKLKGTADHTNPNPDKSQLPPRQLA